MRSDVYYEKDEADIDLSPNWKVLFGISALMLTMHWKCQRRLTCNSEWRESGIPRNRPLRW